MAEADLNLCYMSATEAIALFKARKLSPVELMSAVIARAEAVNPRFNALTYCFFERALEQARKAEARYVKSNERPRRLEGIPCAIKDFHAVKGEITTFGSKIYEAFRPESSAPTVERLLRAGAIMHTRTTTPEFAHSAATRSPLWGVTRNPYNLEYSPGGSSGGASAALAAGMTTIADGTDAGGSVRIPAAACNIVGYKPPFGRNPLDADHPLETLLHYGPMTRSVADAALMQNVMSGPHAADMLSLKQRLRLPERFKSPQGLRLALSMDLGCFEIDPVVEANTRAAVTVLAELGCTVEEVALDWNMGMLDPYLCYWEAMAAAFIGEDRLTRYRYDMDPFLVGMVQRGMTHGASRHYKVNLVRGEMFRKLVPILERYDALLCPTLAVPSVKADHDNADPDFRINGKRVPAYLNWCLTWPFNMVSPCPVMALPSGFCPATGLPTSIQIVGRTYDDTTVFRLASAYEAARPWRTYRPAL
jgi:amidase